MAASRLGQPFTVENVDRSPHDGGITPLSATGCSENTAFVRNQGEEGGLMIRGRTFRRPVSAGGLHHRTPTWAGPCTANRPARGPACDRGGWLAPGVHRPASARADLFRRAGRGNGRTPPRTR